MRSLRALVLLSLCAAVCPHSALADEPLAVVTAVTGRVMIARANNAPEEPLRFRDAIHLRDRVTTSDRSMTRMLLGGRVVVTARERSQMTLTEVPGASTIDIAAGRVAVTVDRAKLAAGELVEVRTPHAVTAVAGDTLIVEVRADHSAFTVLGGRIEVFRIDPRTGEPLEPATIVGARHSVDVKDGAVSRPRPVTAVQAQLLAGEFTPPVRPMAGLDLGAVKDELTRALEALAAATLGTGQLAAPPPALLFPPTPPPALLPPGRPEFRPGRQQPIFLEFSGPFRPGRGRDGGGPGPGPGPRH